MVVQKRNIDVTSDQIMHGKGLRSKKKKIVTDLLRDSLLENKTPSPQELKESIKNLYNRN